VLARVNYGYNPPPALPPAGRADTPPPASDDEAINPTNFEAFFSKARGWLGGTGAPGRAVSLPVDCLSCHNHSGGLRQSFTPPDRRLNDPFALTNHHTEPAEEIGDADTTGRGGPPARRGTPPRRSSRSQLPTGLRQFLSEDAGNRPTTQRASPKPLPPLPLLKPDTGNPLTQPSPRRGEEDPITKESAGGRSSSSPLPYCTQNQTAISDTLRLLSDF
jgi:hypothetical protein